MGMKKRSLIATLSISAASSLIATFMVASPAIADAEIILPADVNSSNTSGLLTYACPSHVVVYAPVPTNTVDPLSSREPAQLGVFRWTLEHMSSEVDAMSFWGQAKSRQLLFTPESELNPGDTVQLNLRASIIDAPVTYEDSIVDFTVTVVDPTFAEGSGTIVDPFVVRTAADLQKMRCHEFKHFKLANDVNLNSKWLPIAHNRKDWKGHFDGGNFSITGLNVGDVTMEEAGLFGSITNSSIKNLRIIRPIVAGSYRTGTLVGSAREGVTLSNIRISGAEINSQDEAGILIGHKSYGGLVNDVYVEGKFSLEPAVLTRFLYWSGETEVAAGTVSDTGGLVGFDSGSGTTYLRNEVNVQINVWPSIDVAQFALDNSLILGGNGSINEIGGLVGEGGANSTYEFNKAKADINIEAYGSVNNIGGAFGRSASPASRMSVESNIHIVSLGATEGPCEIIRIGGAVGYADSQTISYTNVVSQILIEAADGTNNSENVNNLNNVALVSKIGGMGGKWDDNTSDMYNRVKTDIEIRDVSAIEHVAGFVGHYGNDDSLGYTDNFVSGSIKLNAFSTIERVGGFSNLGDDGALAGERLFAATRIETSGSAALSEINPFVGENDLPERQMAAFSYWDSSLNSDENPASYPALPASTNQLKSSSFLRATGMDFENVWKLSAGSYPELRPGVYTWGFADSSRVITVPSAPIIVKPEGPTGVIIPKAAKQGSTVVVSGNKLNRVTDVYVGGKRVSYTVKTDGTLTFITPKLAPKSYLVTIQSDFSESRFESKMRVTKKKK